MENKIRELCKEKNVTPYRVAKDLGWKHVHQIYEYISGRTTPTTERSIAIAKYFDKEVSDIWTSKES